MEGTSSARRKPERDEMAEFKHGEMDITEQTRTFDGFMRVVSRFVVACIVLLLFLAIFAT